MHQVAINADLSGQKISTMRTVSNKWVSFNRERVRQLMPPLFTEKKRRKAFINSAYMEKERKRGKENENDFDL